MGQQRRRKSWLRELVVAELRNGPLEDEKGRVLQVLAERVGHHSSMSVGNVIRVLESEGSVTRMTAKDGQAPRDPDGNPSPHVRRTYRVALTEAFIATLPPIEVPPAIEPELVEPVAVVTEPEVELAPALMAEGDFQLPEGIDYDLVAHAVLGVVFKNLTASEEVLEVRSIRKELAEAKAALAEAKQVINALGEDLRVERKHRGKVEHEATALSLEVEALKAELKASSERIDSARTKGWEVRDIISEQSAKELDKIMRAVPTARG